MDVHDRRRLVLAAALTVVAMPALFLIDRNDSSGSTAPAVAAAGVPTPGADAASDVAENTYEPETPVFLDDSVPLQAPAVIDIVIPAAAGDRQKTATASFQRYIDPKVVRPCTTTLAPTGVLLVITNLNNGQVTTCTNTMTTAPPPGVDMTIDTDVFVAIADLTDAPIPVQLNW